MLKVYRPLPVVFDLESQQTLQHQVKRARLEHQWIAWKSRQWIAWAMLVMLVLGWIHAYDHAMRSITTRVHMLYEAGPPIECYYHTNDPEHPIPLSLQIAYWLSIDDPRDVCHRYYVQLARSRWPNPWSVTVEYMADTFVQPFRQGVGVLSSVPWFLQTLLVLSLSLSVVVYLSVKFSPIPIRLKSRSD